VGVALVSLVFPLLAGTAKAVQVDNKWTGATSANWSDTGNWSAGHVPTSAETVRFDNASTANLNTIVNACAPGDLNCDGTVDAGDYVTWRKANGSAADYNAIRANFGTTPGIGFPISGIANTSVSVSGVNVGPNIGGAATNVTITGFPLRIGATGRFALTNFLYWTSSACCFSSAAHGSLPRDHACRPAHPRFSGFILLLLALHRAKALD